MESDPKLAIFGTTGFAFREHPITWKSVDNYCKHDIIMRPLISQLKKAGKNYAELRKEDTSKGLIYVVEADPSFLKKGTSPSLFIPTEVLSKEQIPTSDIKYILTLEKDIEHVEKKYGYEAKPIEEIIPDELAKRLYSTLYTRFSRLILGRL